ncbi:MAG: hypothetical protein AAF224_09270 [Pseudomonadota bacterium]
MSLTGQYPLDLPFGPAKLGRTDFIETPANRLDLPTLDAWAASDEFALAICGAPSAGKTHLASILATEHGGELVTVADDGGIDRVADGALFVIDGVDRLTRPTLLLEAIERARSSAGARIVVTGRGDPKDWAGGLRDLETRLGALSRLTVSPPDEELLRRVIDKLFTDRQLSVDEKVIDYAAPRLARSLDAARAFVSALDVAAIAGKARISIALARKVIDKEENLGL